MSDIDDLRRLVQRTFEFQRSAVIERRIPGPFVDLFPIPPGATLLGSVLRGDEADPEQITAYLDVPGSADAIKSWYDTKMASLGYQPHVPRQPDGPPGGFRHSMQPFGQPFGAGGTYCKGPDAPYSRSVFAAEKTSRTWSSAGTGVTRDGIRVRPSSEADRRCRKPCAHCLRSTDRRA